MKKLFFVNRAMCGGDSLPDDFDLEEFCEVLQGKVADDIEILPATGVNQDAQNLDPRLISTTVFNEALGEYGHR